MTCRSTGILSGILISDISSNIFAGIDVISLIDICVVFKLWPRYDIGAVKGAHQLFSWWKALQVQLDCVGNKNSQAENKTEPVKVF